MTIQQKIKKKKTVFPELKEQDILLVELEGDWGRCVYNTFKGYGSNVCWIKSQSGFKETIEWLSSDLHPAAAIVIDKPPVLNGAILLNDLKETFEGLPVVMLLEDLSQERIAKLFSFDPFCCLPKPVHDMAAPVLLGHARKALEFHLLFNDKLKAGKKLKNQEESFLNIIKKSTKKIYEAYKKLKELDRLKMDLITLISHQIRTPLCTILSQSELLLDGLFENKEDLKQMINSIQSQGRRIARFVNDTTSFLSYRLGRATFEFSEFSLAGVIAQGVEMVELQAIEKGINLNIDVPAGLSVKSDFGSIFEVIQRVLENGIVYSNPGSNIWIRAIEEKDNIIIEIEDEGKGVDPKMLSRLCDPLEAGEDMRYHVDGNGMGLAISSEMLRALGGGLKIESAGKDQGCMVKIILPLRKTA